ncbi:MAG: hypothetical protein ABIO19_14590, partial [Burkholderiaceae bacterium]
LLQSISKAFALLQSSKKTKLILLLDSWSIATDLQLKALLEQASLSDYEKKSLKDLVSRVGAFKSPEPATSANDVEDIPF